MSKQSFVQLIDAFGDACFDCGEWQLDKYAEIPYAELLAVQQDKRQAVIDAHVGLREACKAAMLHFEPICDHRKDGPVLEAMSAAIAKAEAQ